MNFTYRRRGSLVSVGNRFLVAPSGCFIQPRTPTSLSGDLNAPAPPTLAEGAETERPVSIKSANLRDRAGLSPHILGDGPCSNARVSTGDEAMSKYKNGNAPASSPRHLRSVPDDHDKRSQKLPNKRQSQSPLSDPRSFWCKVSWDAYRVERLPPDNPRRRPTLARVRYLDGGES